MGFWKVVNGVKKFFFGNGKSDDDDDYEVTFDHTFDNGSTTESKGYKKSSTTSQNKGAGMASFDYGSALVNAATSIYNNERNIAFQKKVNAENLEFARDELSESTRQFEKNYAQSEYWNTVSQSNFENATQIRAADMARAGINPLAMTATSDGQTISPAQSSGTAGNPNQQAPRSQIDLSALTEVAMQMAEHKWQSEENEKNRAIEEQRLKNEAEKNENDYLLGLMSNSNASESNRIREKEVDEFIRNNLAGEKLQQSMLDETKRKNTLDNLLQQQGLDLKEREFALKKIESDRNYRKMLEDINNERIKINQIQQKIDNAKDEFAKNYLEKQKQRRWDTVTKLTTAVLNLAGNIASASISAGF